MGGPFKMRGSPFQRNFGIGSPVKKTYKEAYAGLSAERKAKQTEAEFTKEAEDWNIEKYGTKEPTKESKKLKPHYKDVTDVKSGKKKLADVTAYERKEKARTDAETKAFREKQKQETITKRKKDAEGPTTKKPETLTRKEIRAQKQKSKEAGMSKKDIKTQKLKSKLAAADPDSRKAKRLARRYDRRTTVKAKKGKAGKKQQIASAEEKFPGGITIRG